MCEVDESMNRLNHPSGPPSRRGFLRVLLALPALLLFGDGASRRRSLAATPACQGNDEATPPQTAGPFYRPRSPQRVSLIEPGIEGARIVLRGRVTSTDCRPVAGALVDLWQADAAGVYDNSGYQLRGHQFADEAGRYAFTTVIPGLYPGRTRHFHVRVQAPKRPVLTTQLYFPGEEQNRRDRIFDRRLLVALGQSGSEKVATFDFVLDAG
jgi:protocatechuate 3,4-dioxygenase beta subunit